ncbi:MAG TPA: aminopeptidase P N-terminal domain-containing protein [Longimicrobiales bacterium]|nr:aminopeptidase P N-terminal domain-containing protein [Longimicrobiales bacterium]
MSDVARFHDRRTRVLAQLGEQAAMVLVAGPELRIGRDTELRYAPDADFYYLTGIVEPEAVLVLGTVVENGPCALFVRERDPERELWSGERLGPDRAREVTGVDSAFPLSELAERLPKMLAGADVLYARLDAPPIQGFPAIAQLVSTGRRRRAREGAGIHTVAEPGLLLDELRLRKDDDEIARIRNAARITVAAFENARDAIRDGAGEWEVEAALDGSFRALGGDGPAFPTIVGSGPNATVLHYVANNRRMRAGDLVLLDAGARADMYCADISRTCAVGVAKGEVRMLHQVVRDAHDRAIAAARPGARIGDVHDAACDALAEGLVALGLMRKGLEGDERTNALRRYYPHQTSHWLGLDVHDVGDYVIDGRSRRLEPGMVFTVEPGLYVGALDSNAPGSLRGVGVRIEDDLLVTSDGVEVLTEGAALEIS